MVAKTKRLDGTLIDLQASEAGWSQKLVDQVLPSLVQRLEQRFGDRHGLSPEQGVSSAVRILLKPKSKDLRFESIEDLRRWLYTVAWRKVKDAVERERFKVRIAADEACEQLEEAVISGCETAHRILATFRESLNEEERIVLDRKLNGENHDKIAQENNWTQTRVDTVWRRIVRRARRQLG